MGDWSNFFKGIGEIVNEISKSREEYLRTQNNNTGSVQITETRNGLYPDLRNISNNANSTPADQIPIEQNAEKVTKNRRRRNQRRADDEEEWEVVGDRNKNQNQNPASDGGNSGNSTGTFAALGLAGLAFGAYAAYKAYSDVGEKPSPSLVPSHDQCLKQLKKIKQDIDVFPVIGMDCQWLISTSPYDPRSPIALLQLATHKGNVMLIPMNKFSVPDEVRSILSNPEIIKTGIEVIKDARYLREDYGLAVKSTFDLRFLSEDTMHRPLGLEKSALDVLNLDIGRDWEIIKSDWENWPLDPKQISYAETAVKACIDIFTTLYPFTGNGPSKREVLAYCMLNKDRPFIWDTKKHGINNE